MEITNIKNKNTLQKTKTRKKLDYDENIESLIVTLCFFNKILL